MGTASRCAKRLPRVSELDAIEVRCIGPSVPLRQHTCVHGPCHRNRDRSTRRSPGHFARSFQPGAVFRLGQRGPADHWRVRSARGVRQQPKSGVEPGPATRSLPQSQSRAARSDDRRPGRPTSEQARRRPEKADDDQDGARVRLHLHPRGRVVLAAGPPGLLSGTAPTRRYSIGASDWCARGVTAGRRI